MQEGLEQLDFHIDAFSDALSHSAVVLEDVESVFQFTVVLEVFLVVFGNVKADRDPDVADSQAVYFAFLCGKVDGGFKVVDLYEGHLEGIEKTGA